MAGQLLGSDWLSPPDEKRSDWPSRENAGRSIHGFPPEFLDHVANPQGLIKSDIKDDDNNNINVDENELTVISTDYNEINSERTPYEDYDPSIGTSYDQAKV